jgi:hypothetical protein
MGKLRFKFWGLRFNFRELGFNFRELESKIGESNTSSGPEISVPEGQQIIAP